MNAVSLPFLNRLKLILLGFFSVVAALVFVFQGLSCDNVDFFLPRRLMKIAAIVVSAWCIGYTAITFQTITCNKILTPAVMGLDSLYLFIQTVILFFYGTGKPDRMTESGHFFLSIGFMIGISLVLFKVLFGKERQSVYYLPLSGLIIGALFQSLATFMHVMMDPNEFLVLQGKMFASFNNVNINLLWPGVGVCVTSVGLTCRDYPALDVLSLGRDQAVNLGLSYRTTVLKSLIVTAVLVSVSTALIGPITFSGILVATSSRQLLASFRHTILVTGSFLLGCFFLITAQCLVERVFQFGTTVGVIINFIGGLYFIYLILKETKA